MNCETCKWWLLIKSPKGKSRIGHCQSLMSPGIYGGIKLNHSRPMITTGPGDKYPVTDKEFGCKYYEEKVMSKGDRCQQMLDEHNESEDQHERC